MYFSFLLTSLGFVYFQFYSFSILISSFASLEQLTADPNDVPAREKLAHVLATDLGKLQLGIEQLRLLIEILDTSDEQRAKWHAQIALWELKLTDDEEKYEQRLHEIIQKFPQTSQAFGAQRRLFLLEQRRPLATPRG
jgi:hypothetical protein